MSLSNSGNPNLLNSPAGLWWRYVNHGGSELGGIFYAVFGSLWFAFGLTASWLAVRSEIPFWLHGRTVNGMLIGKWLAGEDHPRLIAGLLLAHGGRRRVRSQVNWVSYEFQDAAGKKYQGQGALPQATWNAVKIGDKLAISYVSNNPARNRPLESRGNAGPLLFLPLFVVIGAAMVYGGVGSFLSGIRRLSRQIELVRFGQAAAGVVVECSETWSGRRSPAVFQCSYEYLVPEQADEPAQVKQGNITLDRHTAQSLKRGDFLLVLYDRDHPDEHAVDIHNLRSEQPAALLPRRASR